MTKNIMKDFANQILLQVKINRVKHHDEGAESDTDIQKWFNIMVEHMGHLAVAVRNNDSAEAEKELLHIGGPMLEMYNALKLSKEKVY